MSDSTLGEWVETVLGIVLLPAHIASYLLPLYFCWRFIRRFVFNKAYVVEGREHRRKNFWGAYLPAERCHRYRFVSGRPLRALPRPLGDRVRRGNLLTWPLVVGAPDAEDRCSAVTRLDREAAMAAFAKSWRQGQRK
jgi:hypothetical protein